MKRTFKHWTPRYIHDRVVEKNYRRREPDLPWLTPAANSFLDSYLKAEDKGIEFGSGRSTVWFAGRIASLISVEHNAQWFEKVKLMLSEKELSNIDYHLCEASPETTDADSAQVYVKPAELTETNSLDFALIDGIQRGFCALAVLDKIKPGGMIVIDNVNIYLPSDSFSPNSRTYAQGPISPEWAQYLEVVRSWRFYWTSNGVSDTAFYFKP